MTNDNLGSYTSKPKTIPAGIAPGPAIEETFFHAYAVRQPLLPRRRGREELQHTSFVALSVERIGRRTDLITSLLLGPSMRKVRNSFSHFSTPTLNLPVSSPSANSIRFKSAPDKSTRWIPATAEARTLYDAAQMDG